MGEVEELPARSSRTAAISAPSASDRSVLGRGQKGQQRGQILDRQFGPDLAAGRPRRSAGPAALQARMISGNRSDRRCTRIRKSPGRTGRRTRTPPSPSSGIVSFGDHPADFIGDPRGQDHGVMLVARAGRPGRSSGLVVGRVRLVDHRPEIDAPGQIGLEGACGDAGREAGRGAAVEDAYRPAAGSPAPSGTNIPASDRQAVPRCPPAAGRTPRCIRSNASRVGALEGIDRLLLVADHEDRARRSRRARRSPLVNSCARLLDHVPLRRAGVLRLVDQDVVDAAVEPVQHPGRDRAGRSADRAALQDQIVEIEPAAQLACARS